MRLAARAKRRTRQPADTVGRAPHDYEKRFTAGSANVGLGNWAPEECGAPLGGYSPPPHTQQAAGAPTPVLSRTLDSGRELRHPGPTLPAVVRLHHAFCSMSTHVSPPLDVHPCVSLHPPGNGGHEQLHTPRLRALTQAPRCLTAAQVRFPASSAGAVEFDLNATKYVHALSTLRIKLQIPCFSLLLAL